MSKLLAALIGAGVAVGVGYFIWRVCKERDRRANDEAAKRESDAAQGSDAEQRPNVSAEAPASSTGSMPSTEPAPREPTPAAPPTTPNNPPARASSTAPGSGTEPAPPATNKTAPATPPPASSDEPASSAASTALAPSAAAPASSAPMLGPKQLATATDPGPQTARQSLSRLFEHARRIIPDLTLAEFTAARTIASAPDHGTPAAWTATATAERHGAPADLARLTEHIARPGGSGYQASRGPKAATNTRGSGLVHTEAGG